MNGHVGLHSACIHIRVSTIALARFAANGLTKPCSVRLFGAAELRIASLSSSTFKFGYFVCHLEQYPLGCQSTDSIKSNKKLVMY